jgi:hypothetical protein
MLKAYCYSSIRSRDIVFDLFLGCGRTEESDQFLSFSRFLSSDLSFCVTLHRDTPSLPYLVTLLKFGFHTGATQQMYNTREEERRYSNGATHAGRAACISTGQEDKMT